MSGCIITLDGLSLKLDDIVRVARHGDAVRLGEDAVRAVGRAATLVGVVTNSKALQSWWAQINEWRKRDCLAYDRESPKIKPQFVVEKLCQVTHGDAIITSDVGQHQMFAAQYYRFDKPRRWVNSGSLGTMGVGLPYAMGAALANPGVPVACITGAQ